MQDSEYRITNTNTEHRIPSPNTDNILDLIEIVKEYILFLNFTFTLFVFFLFMFDTQLQF